MRRSVAVAWHASFFVLAGALYFFFVLPRWYELLDYWTPALGNPLRIADGVLIGLCALPVVFTLQRMRRPEFGTPQLALSLLLWSVVLHVLAGVLVAGAAISEYWLDLDTKGQWLFGVYGAAAAVAVLGALSFYLAFVAELPPPPPKPLKVKTSRRGRKSADDSDDDAADAADEPETTAVEEASVEELAEPEPEPEPESAADSDVTETTASTDNPTDAEAQPGEAGGKLRNRRPADKPVTRRFGRRRGGVALDD